jgi:sodium/proline symporter
MSLTVLSVLLVYVVILVAIGLWARRESTDVAGYYVAGKRLPSWVIAFSTNATGESAWLLLGLTGMGYLVGIHALWIVVGEVVGVALAWIFVARPFKEYTDRFNSITVPDFLEDRFRDSRRVIRRLSAFVILTMVAAYTAAQLTAAGKAFEAFLGISYAAGAIIGTIVVLYYTTVGGFKAVAYNDLVHGILMFLCLLLLPIVGITAAGGWMPLMESLHATDPDLLRPMGAAGFSVTGVMSVLGFLAVGLAFLGVPQLLTRFISARHRDEAAPAGVIGVLCLIVFDTGAVFAGMAGRAVFPGLADPETIMPMMSTELFPALFTGIFLLVVLAAIMSTADSLLILASSVVVRDVVQKIYRPHMSERRLAMYGKLTTVVLGVAALVVALGEVRVIFWFVLFAWSGLAAAFVPVVLCALYWRRTTLAGAIAGMSAGFVTTVVWMLWIKPHVYDLYEMLPGVVAGLVSTIGVSLFTRPPEGIDREFDEVRAVVGHPYRRTPAARATVGEAVAIPTSAPAGGDRAFRAANASPPCAPGHGPLRGRGEFFGQQPKYSQGASRS